MNKEAEVTLVAQVIAAEEYGMDLEWVVEEWPEFDQTKYRQEAQRFIALHDALQAHRKANEQTAAELYDVYAVAPFEQREVARQAWQQAERLEEAAITEEG